MAESEIPKAFSEKWPFLEELQMKDRIWKRVYDKQGR
jgi:hypothetical protein